MSGLLYQLETIEALTEENLAIFRHGGSEGKKHVYFFELALLELLYDPEQDQHYIVALDLASNRCARKWPTSDLTEWSELVGRAS